MKLFTIPNLLTLGNLFCGCLSLMWILNIIESNHTFSSPWIDIILNIGLFLLLVSLILDFLDGLVARLTKTYSEIGTQLDSLADMISFGVVPGLIMFYLLRSTDSLDNPLNAIQFNTMDYPYLSFFGLLITLSSALRLAKFNVDTEQTTYFKGLATPANTILIFSLFWIKLKNGFIISKEWDLYFLIGITILSCYLLIANLPLFSFKFKGFAWKDNDYKYVFLIISLILLVLFQMNSVPFIILLYIITSILFKKKIIHVA